MTPDIDHTSSLAGSIGDKIDGFFYRCLNDKDYTMVHLSAGFEAMLGYDADWFISTKQSFAALTHPDDLPKVDKAVADATSKGGHWRISYRLRAKSGEYLPIFETGGSFRDPNTGKEMYLDGVILDLRHENSQGASRTQAARDIAVATGAIMKTLKTLRLLALNARLEAVRAGDHGLGFSIVAREMVDLAAQSDVNARAIERLITQLDDDTGLAA